MSKSNTLVEYFVAELDSRKSLEADCRTACGVRVNRHLLKSREVGKSERFLAVLDFSDFVVNQDFAYPILSR